MIALLVLLLASGLSAYSGQTTLTPDQQSLVNMQKEVDSFDKMVLDRLPEEREKHPFVPQSFFTAVQNDAEKLLKESVTDPAFSDDLNQLADDIDGLNIEIDLLQDTHLL